MRAVPVSCWDCSTRVRLVPADPTQQARNAVRDAQARFERDAEAVRNARRKAFADAQAAGLSLRAIAKEAGLHHSRIAEVIHGK
jgi:ribosome recycling factor